MRTRDQSKYDAIVDASIKLVNELGFDGISISKIAAQAEVSPATIYIYFKNKEDLFTKIYIDVRQKMSEGALQDVQEDMALEQAFKTAMHSTFQFYLDHRDFMFYRERFEQTSMMQSIDENQFELYRFSTSLLQRGVKEGIIRNLPIPLLAAFSFVPIITILRLHLDGVLKMSKKEISEACDIAWDSIRKLRE